MPMTLEELTEHTAQLRACLEAHRHSLPDVHPAAAEHKRKVIAALDPRVRELEEQCARLTAERIALGSRVQNLGVPGAEVLAGLYPEVSGIPVVPA